MEAATLTVLPAAAVAMSSALTSTLSPFQALRFFSSQALRGWWHSVAAEKSKNKRDQSLSVKIGGGLLWSPPFFISVFYAG
jgi:hypothetical protein